MTMENVAGEGSVSVNEDLVCLLWEVIEEPHERD